MAAAPMEEEQEFVEAELQVAAILCDLRRILRARDRRRRRRDRAAAPEIPSWGRRRPRSMPEDKPAASAPVRDGGGAASPDTPLAFPESAGDDAAEPEEAASKDAAHDQWVQEQQVAVASLSQERAHLLKQIEEYRARLQSSRSTNESLKQLHKVTQQQRRAQEQEQARELRVVAAPALGLDLNEPALEPEEDEAARAEWFRQARLRAAQQKAAATAGARRRRLEILRAKASSPLVSSRARRGG